MKVAAMSSSLTLRVFRSMSTSTLTPRAFLQQMKQCNIRRVSLVYDLEQNKLVASHPMFADLAKDIQQSPDFHQHEGLYLEMGNKSGELLAATLHCTTRGPGAGGVRYWKYDSVADMLRDGLRLSQGMGRKNALAGLWWGGGKGAIAASSNDDAKHRQNIFNDYGDFVSSLHGCYVTAEDVGVVTKDMDDVFANTRHTTCISPDKGGSGNPSILTAHGVVSAMEAAIDFLRPGDTLAGKTIAVQGLGNVSRALIAKLLEKNVARIVGSDVSEKSIQLAKEQFKNSKIKLDMRLVKIGDNAILSEEADIVCPCALGGSLNAQTIPTIKAKIVVGAANNQLLNELGDDVLLAKKGIIFVPDFVANRMGIVNCANEMHGYMEDDPAILAHFDKDDYNSIFNVTQRILKVSGIATNDSSNTTSMAARALADKQMLENHPLNPQRSRTIQKYLRRNEWSKM